MHEMSIALSIVEAVESRALEEGARKVSAIDLLVGRLSGIEPESLIFCFSAASNGTLAEGAVLAIEEREGMGECLDCGKKFPVSFYYAQCPGCGSMRIAILSGEEFQIQSMTIEEEGE
ncbi:MAG: hydrogenase maturation nickel metallochaperone HypA [Chlorobiaceae bacterium]|nr:hydrogenase maturation nickel metallochaperone HypA [Chlorobiaceae bacterium]